MKCMWIGLAAAFGLWGQEPAVDQASLMGLRFYQANGGFLVEHLPAFHLPPDSELSLVVSGPVSQTLPLRQGPMGDFPGYTMLQANGPGVLRLGKPGKYEMLVKAGDRIAGRLAFTLAQENGEFVRDGDWPKFGFFAQDARNPDAPLKFHFWVSLREMAAPKSRSMLTVHLMAGSKEVGATPSPVVVSLRDWQWFQVELAQPKGAGAKYLTASMLGNGDYTVVVKADGQALKSYRARVTGGKLIGAPGTAIQRVDISSGSNSSYKLTDTAWVSR
ncbi:MAG: hypothetical protein R2762_04630 [Bryobacteraceae bacterium]